MATKTWYKLKIIYKTGEEFVWGINTEELVSEIQSKITDAMDDNQSASVVTFFDHDGDFAAIKASEILYAYTVKRVDGDYDW